MQPTIIAAILITLGGACIATQAPINAGLARQIGSPIVAAAISFGVGFLILTGAGLLTGSGRSFGRALGVDWYFWLGGVLGAFYVWAMVWSLPRLGAFTAICAVALGQILAAILLDRFGAFGLPIKEISLPRILAALMVGGGLVLSRF